MAAAVVAAAVVVALVVALGWLPGSGSDDPDGKAASQSSGVADTTASASSGSPSPSPGPDESPGSDETPPTREAGLPASLRGCAASIDAAQRVVGAARQGVTDWRDHVQARTDMLDGRMSVETMDAIWARTRAAGPGDQERFEKALRADDEPSSCTDLQGLSASDQEVADRCRQRSRSAARALRSAKAAMKDWRVHLTNMAMFADDEMSATMAQAKWVESWRNAPKNISAYEAARAALADAPACAGAA